MSSDNEAEMERGIAQTMNALAPGAIFSYARRGVTMKVNDWMAEPLEVTDGDRIMERIAGQIDPFRNSDAEPWNDFRDTEVMFRRVTQVDAEFFPRTLVCKDCSAVTYRNSVNGLRDTRGNCRTQNCSGQLQQIQFVLVHDCGAVTNLEPRPCNQHGFDFIVLQKGAAEDLGTWSFRCRGNGCDHETDLAGQCNGCGEYIGFPTPVEAGSVHYTQRDAFAEIPMVGVRTGEIPYGEAWCRVLMAGYLGNPDYRSEGISPESVASIPGLDDDQLDNYINELGAENRDTVLEMVRELSPGDGYTRNTVVKINREDVTVPDEREWYTLVSDQLFTFIRSTDGYEADPDDLEEHEGYPNPRSIDHYLEDKEFVAKHPEAKLYRHSLNSIGISDAWVVDNFPLLNILFGYTRDSPTASQTDLRSFEHPYDSDGISIYGDRSPSEAIVLELDRKKIVEWLLANGSLTEPDAPDTDDEEELKQWFLENVDPRQTQNPFTPIEDQLTEEIYKLIHSTSHSLMSTASEQCGLDRDSISELLLPNVPAIVLYAKSMEHFALGGMFTLFKTRLNDWVEETKSYVESCIYDPACRSSDGGAACHACMHVAEFTCEYYNQTLDRNVLTGSGELEGFWEI